MIYKNSDFSKNNQKKTALFFVKKDPESTTFIIKWRQWVYGKSQG